MTVGMRTHAFGGGAVGLAVAAMMAALLAAAPSALAAEPERLAGDTRYGTAVRISAAAFPDGAATVYVARSDAFPDALAAGALTDGPVLLVPRTGAVPDVVMDEIERLDPDEVIGLGGEQAIDPAVLEQVSGGPPTARLAGGDRYATAVRIAQRAFPGSATTVYLARGDDFPDALAAGALTDGPVLLVPRTGSPPDVVVEEIDRLDPTQVIALGGLTAIDGDVVARAADGRPTSRLAGGDRYETAVRIAERAFAEGSPTIYVARGDDFPDALAAGALTDGPVLLVERCGNVPPAAAGWLSAVDPDTVVALGGTSAVCDHVLDAAAAGLVCDPTRDACLHFTGTVRPDEASAEGLFTFLADRVGQAVELDVEILVNDTPSADGWLSVPGSHGLDDCQDPDDCGAEYRADGWQQTSAGWRLTGSVGVFSLAGPQMGWFSIVLGDPSALPPTLGLQATGPVVYGATVQEAVAASDGRFRWSYAFTEEEDGYNCGEGWLEGVGRIGFLVTDVVEYAAVWTDPESDAPPVRTEGGGELGMTMGEVEAVAERLDADVVVEQHVYDPNGYYVFVHPRSSHLQHVGYRFDVTDRHGTGELITTAILAGGRNSIRTVEGCV